MLPSWSLPDDLRGSFHTYVACVGDIDGINAVAESRAVGEWVGFLRDEFYDPQRPGKVAASARFLRIERVLMELMAPLSDEFRGVFWSFFVQLAISLAQPPEEASSSRSTPNAPLAVVVMSALRKLIVLPEHERLLHASRAEGRENRALRTFCDQHMAHLPPRVDAKVLVELLELFQVESVSRIQVEGLAQWLLQTKAFALVVKLCVVYQTLCAWDFAGLLRTMIAAKDWASAEALARAIERKPPLATVLVEEAAALRDMKRAHRLMDSFELRWAFPDLDQMYSRDALHKLMEKQRWALALSFVGRDAALQHELLTHLVAARQWEYATLLARDTMGLSDFDPEREARALEDKQTTGSAPASLTSLPVNGYLELLLPDESVVMCDTEEAVRRAAEHVVSLESATVGLDVEWRPTSSASASAVASILQIATPTQVFLVDLLTLHDNDFLFDGFLLPLFTSNAILKVGFGFDSDLRVLHQTFPERQAFRCVRPFLELRSVVQKTLGGSVSTSLSNATAQILGKPLDKRMQMSNWEDRPLSHSQAVYATLDAFCLLQIVSRIKGDGLRAMEWEEVRSRMVGEIALCAPIEDPAVIAAAVESRRDYQRIWTERLCHHGVVEKENLLPVTHVEAFWRKRVAEDGDEDATELRTVSADQLQSLLAGGENQPTAYVAVNSICFFANDSPCVACIDAGSKLDVARLAAVCGFSRRKIKLATAMECETVWGFSPGTVAPFGHRSTGKAISIFVDVQLQSYEHWITGSGSHDVRLIIKSSAFFASIKPHSIVDIARTRTGQSTMTHPPVVVSVVSSPANGQRTHKFVADTMMGRVARWLGSAGVDVVTWDSQKSNAEETKTEMLAFAAREQRIVLTHDKKLALRHDAGICFVVSNSNPRRQLHEVWRHFELKLPKDDMVRRCPACKAKQYESVARAFVLDHRQDVSDPGPITDCVEEFWKCGGCGRITVGPLQYNSAYQTMSQLLAKFET